MSLDTFGCFKTPCYQPNEAMLPSLSHNLLNNIESKLI